MEQDSSSLPWNTQPIAVPETAYIPAPTEQVRTAASPVKRPVRAAARIQQVDSVVRSGSFPTGTEDKWKLSDRVAYPSWNSEPSSSAEAAGQVTRTRPTMSLDTTIRTLEDGHLQGHKVPTSPWQLRQAAADMQRSQHQVLQEISLDETGSRGSSAFRSTPPRPAVWAVANIPGQTVQGDGNEADDENKENQAPEAHGEAGSNEEEDEDDSDEDDDDDSNDEDSDEDEDDSDEDDDSEEEDDSDDSDDEQDDDDDSDDEDGSDDDDDNEDNDDNEDDNDEEEEDENDKEARRRERILFEQKVVWAYYAPVIYSAY